MGGEYEITGSNYLRTKEKLILSKRCLIFMKKQLPS